MSASSPVPKVVEGTALQSCAELSKAHIDGAMATRVQARALLAHLAAISKPRGGAPKILLLFAAMAAATRSWVGKGFRVELRKSDAVTLVDCTVEAKVGGRERLFPSFVLNAPLDEFAKAADRAAAKLTPLVLDFASTDQVILVAASSRVSVEPVAVPPLAPVTSLAEMAKDLPPPAVKISDDDEESVPSSRTDVPLTGVPPPAAPDPPPSQKRGAMGRPSVRVVAAPPRRTPLPASAISGAPAAPAWPGLDKAAPRRSLRPPMLRDEALPGESPTTPDNVSGTLPIAEDERVSSVVPVGGPGPGPGGDSGKRSDGHRPQADDPKRRSKKRGGRR